MEWKRYDKEKPSKDGAYIVMSEKGTWMKKQFVTDYAFSFERGGEIKEIKFTGFLMNKAHYMPSDDGVVAWLDVPPCPFYSMFTYNKLTREKNRLEGMLQKLNAEINNLDAEINKIDDPVPTLKIVHDGHEITNIGDDDDEEDFEL